jgi:hypothetical protein
MTRILGRWASTTLGGVLAYEALTRGTAHISGWILYPAVFIACMVSQEVYLVLSAKLSRNHDV